MNRNNFKTNLSFKVITYICIFYLNISYMIAQDNKYEFEFSRLLENKTNLEKLKILEDSALLSTDKQKSLFASNYYFSLAKKEDKKTLANAYRLIGRTYWLIGKLSLSQEQNFMALKLFEESNDTLGLAKTLILIGTVFQLQKEDEKAIKYFEMALEKFKTTTIANLKGSLASLKALNTCTRVYVLVI